MILMSQDKPTGGSQATVETPGEKSPPDPKLEQADEAVGAK